jgi:hypothetical protein
VITETVVQPVEFVTTDVTKQALPFVPELSNFEINP